MDRSKVLVTAGLLVGLLVAALDQTIVDTAFPMMISDLGGVSIFTWVITAYMLASTAVVPVVGKLADIFGRKMFYLGGLVLFVGGSALCGAAQSMTQLIIFRGIQGLGAGMLMPIVFTIIGDMFPGEQRAKMQGLFGGVWGLASILGPKLGGWITHHYSWRWVFYVNLPVGIVAFVLILIGLKESRGERRPIDYAGSFTVTAGIVFFLLALLQGGSEHPWTSAPILAYFAVSALMFIAFVFIERRAEEPVINFDLFKDRTVLVMNLAVMLMTMGMFGAVVYVPWFIQGVVGVDPNTAGNVMTPMMLTIVVFSILAGRLAMKVPYRAQLSLGFLCLLAGFFLMTGWTPETTQLQATFSTLPVGAGLGFMMPIVTLGVQNAVPGSLRGQVTSMSSFFRSTGATLGVAIYGVIFNSQMGQNEPKVVRDFVAMAQTQLPAAPVPLEVKATLMKMFEHPQGLVQLLLQEKIRAGVGQFVPPQVFGQVVQGIKEMMSNSLHTVFWSGMGVVVIGVVVSQLIGSASLSRQIKEAEERGEQVDLHAPMAAD